MYQSGSLSPFGGIPLQSEEAETNFPLLASLKKLLFRRNKL